ncbi:MAG: acyloxyacyl hydrolase [Phycisphaerales bacterium JB060]
MRKDAVIFHLVIWSLALLAMPAAALAQGERVRFIHEPWSGQTDAQTEQGQFEPSTPGYCFENCETWIISYSAAYTGEALDQGITLSYNRFLVDDIEWFLEGGLWSFYDQGADNAFGLSASLGFRWHFLKNEDWSLFADIGIGVLGTTDHVPTDGTSFNFMPRAGVGFTREIDENIRLMGGIRWHHISNARTRGDSRNPSRDAPQIYVGLVVPF